MKVRIPLLFSLALAGSLSGAALANQELAQLSADPNNWAMQAGDFANHRYSKLKQVNASNVNKLQVAWMFSTGVLRGHEGSPLVIGDTMYLHTPFPNNVFAIDLEHAEDQVEVRAEAGSGGDSADVLRHGEPRAGLCRWQGLPAAGRQHAGCAGRQERQGRVEREERRPEGGRGQHQCAAHLQGQGHHRHQRR